jgi:hypothetical protein
MKGGGRRAQIPAGFWSFRAPNWVISRPRRQRLGAVSSAQRASLGGTERLAPKLLFLPVADGFAIHHRDGSHRLPLKTEGSGFTSVPGGQPIVSRGIWSCRECDPKVPRAGPSVLVLARANGPSGVGLTAHVVAADRQAPPTAPDLRAFLQACLPAHMVHADSCFWTRSR